MSDKATDYGLLPGRYPAVVREYLEASRTCRVEILGMTDGADTMPEAEIEYPIGDRSKSGELATEIEILAGDPVWVAFIGGDPRYPIITGSRNPRAGNSVNWRRFHHANMELATEEVMRLIAKSDLLVQSNSKLTLKAGGTTLELTPSGAVLTTPALDINKA